MQVGVFCSKRCFELKENTPKEKNTQPFSGQLQKNEGAVPEVGSGQTPRHNHEGFERVHFEFVFSLNPWGSQLIYLQQPSVLKEEVHCGRKVE